MKTYYRIFQQQKQIILFFVLAGGWFGRVGVVVLLFLENSISAPLASYKDDYCVGLRLIIVHLIPSLLGCVDDGWPSISQTHRHNTELKTRETKIYPKQQHTLVSTKVNNIAGFTFSCFQIGFSL